MGSGKTTIGKRLSRKLDLSFVDCDREMEARTGAPIQLIFDIEGEQGFRQRETRLLDELTRLPHHVLATGGGVVTVERNRELLSQRGFVVYLQTDVERQLERLERDKQRPLLQTPDREQRLRRMADQRNPLYESVADLCVLSSQRSVRHMANIVAKAVLREWRPVHYDPLSGNEA